jgi:hypothetical protein
MLARHRNYRCKKSAAEIATALRGDWRPEHLFTLRQSLEGVALSPKTGDRVRGRDAHADGRARRAERRRATGAHQALEPAGRAAAVDALCQVWRGSDGGRRRRRPDRAGVSERGRSRCEQVCLRRALCLVAGPVSGQPHQRRTQTGRGRARWPTAWPPRCAWPRNRSTAPHRRWATGSGACAPNSAPPPQSPPPRTKSRACSMR